MSYESGVNQFGFLQTLKEYYGKASTTEGQDGSLNHFIQVQVIFLL